MKNTKIAGIAAVTLLAVSPVITNAVSTDCAQASVLGDLFPSPSDTIAHTTALTNTINGLPDQIYSEANPMPATTDFNAIEGLAESGKGVAPVNFSSFFAGINLGMNSDAIKALSDTKVQKLRIYVSGNSLKQSVQNAYDHGNGASFSFTITVKNGDNTIATKTLTYTNNTGKTPAGNETSSTKGLSNVTDLTGHHTVSLAGPSGFVYSLFSLSGKKSNRGLAGETAWYTDKTATDSQGNTYYRVSTDEWVEASGNVSFN
ncbi:hypothetical protein [Companilactobacillus mishanensis]|uniref:WxL domain-containing protein n=1 Tax=Companilactobacillus mishanensis TaxID=2486008 RepID=A0A5P0ZK48_9LACO|nr:hypothetical protein [Companilactobacillus mishanensis]MQS53422.1 hypothetical protein [Companilactobacillus mishanensis]